LIGESYYAVGDYPNALAQFELFLRNHAGHRMEREVRYSRAWIFQSEGNYDRAGSLFGELAEVTMISPRLRYFARCGTAAIRKEDEAGEPLRV